MQHFVKSKIFYDAMRSVILIVSDQIINFLFKILNLLSPHIISNVSFLQNQLKTADIIISTIRL